MKSLATGMLAKDPLRTVYKEMPSQVILGAVIETVMESTNTMGTFGMTSSVGNFAVQIVLSGSMG